MAFNNKFSSSNLSKMAKNKIQNFNIRNFAGTEKNVLGGRYNSLVDSGFSLLENQSKKFLKDGVNDLQKLADEKLDAITIDLKTQRYGGYNVQDAKMLYSRLYDLGSVLASNYFIKFEPYNNNDTKNCNLFDDDLTGFFATEVGTRPIANHDSESMRIGAFTENHLVGSTIPEIPITFIETSDYRFTRSFEQIRQMMINHDGTQNVPSSYVMWLTIGIFSSTHGMTYTEEAKYLVYLSLASIDGLNADAVSDKMRVSASFIVARPFME